MIIQEDMEFLRLDGTVRKFSDVLKENRNRINEAKYHGLTNVTDYNVGSQAYGMLFIYSFFQFMQEWDEELKDENYWIKTATGDALNDHGEQKGVYREEPSFATTNVVFELENALNTPFTILEGTEIATPDVTIFSTMEDITIPTGETTDVVDVVCDEIGTIGNVKAGEINEIITPLNADITVTNPFDVTNGVDMEEDDDYRERILDSWLNYQPRTSEWFEKKAETIVGKGNAKYKKIDAKNGVLIYKPTSGVENSTFAEIFSRKVNEIVDLNLTFQEATPVTVIDQTNLITLFIKSPSVFNIVATELERNIQEYINEVKLGGLFKAQCALYYAEVTEGAVIVKINGLNDFDLSDEEYPVMETLNIVQG